MSKSLTRSTTDDLRPLILGADDVLSLLRGKEAEIIHSITEAYRMHAECQTSLPYSNFLRFPNNQMDRMIALPAYLGGGVQSAGVKWVSSFPGNVQHGIDRASAVLILNSTETGRPKSIMEGSIISAKRTAASAVLAAQVLKLDQPTAVGFVGCGIINFEIARFLHHTFPSIDRLLLFDLNPDRARSFLVRCEDALWGVNVQICSSMQTVLGSATVISFATTANNPYVQNLDDCSPGTVILHISLRDLSPAVILSMDNVVDDIDHVCREQTSVHLAEQQVGHRRFIRCSLPGILKGDVAPHASGCHVSIFSPFGLGILDLALGEFVLQEAISEGKGYVFPSFLPDFWAPHG